MLSVAGLVRSQCYSLEIFGVSMLTLDTLSQMGLNG